MKKDKVERIAELYHLIMFELGIKRNSDNAETPMRVAKSLAEMTDSERVGIETLKEQCTTFYRGKQDMSVVVQNDLEVASFCSHHHLPFFGKAEIVYIPGQYILGLSKFQRIVNYFSRKPQVQEDLTKDILYFLVRELQPQYVSVRIYDCTHSCMCSRGVRSQSKTSTFFEKYSGDLKSHELDKINQLLARK
jgi:GTP cyclohydrolase IA